MKTWYNSICKRLLKWDGNQKLQKYKNESRNLMHETNNHEMTEQREIHLDRDVIRRYQDAYLGKIELSVMTYIALNSIATSKTTQVCYELDYDSFILAVDDGPKKAVISKDDFKHAVQFLEAAGLITIQETVKHMYEYINVGTKRMYGCIALYEGELKTIFKSFSGNELLELLPVYIEIQTGIVYWNEKYMTTRSEWDFAKNIGLHVDDFLEYADCLCDAGVLVHYEKQAGAEWLPWHAFSSWCDRDKIDAYNEAECL